MPRPVAIRADGYRDDGAFLLRLEDAVSRDEKQPAEWRRETCAMIRTLANRLLAAGKATAFDDVKATKKAAAK